MAGVKQCFDEWLEVNGAGKHEDRRIIEQAEDFIDLYALGMRFTDWSDKSTNKDHAGYRKQEGEKLELWVIRRVFADEIAQSFDELKVCRVLLDGGLLKIQPQKQRLPTPAQRERLVLCSDPRYGTGRLTVCMRLIQNAHQARHD